MKTDYEAGVKKLLTMKLYGYWMGKDLDLNETTMDKPAGKELQQGLCSVVGHHIVYKGDKDLEFKETRNGALQVSTGGTNLYSRASCGERPRMRKGGSKRELDIVFAGEQGRRWSSVILGAIPWEIRAAAHNFFKRVDKPEKLKDELKDPSVGILADQANTTNQLMTKLLNELPPATRAFCSNPQYSNLVDRCMGTNNATEFSATDPALRLCGLARAQVASQGAGLQSAIVAQIMADATSNFNEHFKGILKGDPDNEDDGSAFARLGQACKKHTHHFLGLNRRKKMAKQASCMHDGDWVYVSKTWDVWDSDKNGQRVRKDFMQVAFRLDEPSPTVVREVDPATNESPYTREADIKDRALWRDKRKKVPVTLANGFEGAVEYIIRRNICGQNAVDAKSDACDDTVIPDKPEGVKW